MFKLESVHMVIELGRNIAQVRFLTIMDFVAARGFRVPKLQ